MDKHGMRQMLVQQRRLLSRSQIDEGSERVTRAVVALPEWTVARMVAFYAASGGEVDVLALFRDRPATVAACFPRMTASEPRFHRVDHGSQLVPGRWAILEPPTDTPAVSTSDIDFFFVPGVAFDARGNRLGRGGGFYDRALAHAHGLKVGVAWEFQLVDRVPAEDLDVRMDVIVTEQRVMRVGS